MEVRGKSAEALGIELRSQVWQHAPLLTEPFQFLPVEWRRESPSAAGLLGKRSELEQKTLAMGGAAYTSLFTASCHKEPPQWLRQLLLRLVG